MKQLEPKILLSADAITKKLKSSSGIIANLEVHESISSTIDYLQKQPVIFGKISVCLAEHQSQGKGRLGRVWYSPFAANIYLSLACLSQQNFEALSKLSLVVGLTAIKVLEKIGVTEGLKIKWPNDILWYGKKLAGILIEIEAATRGMSKVVISLGLNVNMLQEQLLSTTAIAINQPWTSLQQILNSYQDRNKIIAMLLIAIHEDLQELELTGVNKILEHWQKYDVLYGKVVKFNIGDNQVQGTAFGINEHGHLQVLNQQGKITAYAAGDVQFRLF